MGRRLCEDMDRNSRNCHNSRNSEGTDESLGPLLETSYGAWHRRHLDFGLLASITSENTFLLLKCPVWGTFKNANPRKLLQEVIANTSSER